MQYIIKYNNNVIAISKNRSDTDDGNQQGWSLTS